VIAISRKPGSMLAHPVLVRTLVPIVWHSALARGLMPI
jgi:hypothetical protein